MRKLGLALAFGVLAAGTVAQAQSAGGISNITSSASTAAGIPNGDLFDFGYGAGTTGGPPGASFNSFVNVGAQSITFESANTTAASNQFTQSSSTVAFKVTNNTNQAATFNSTITAAGLGFYLADTSAGGGNCRYTGCPQVQPGGATFASLPGENGLGQVGFNFTIQSTALNADGNPTGTTTLYSLNGSLGLGHDGLPIFLSDNLGDGGGPRGLLNNFRTTLGDDYTGDAGAATAIGFAWDATDISFGIGAGQFQILTYTTSVYSQSTTDCFGSVCLIAYSGFGDPVGAAGAVDNLNALGRSFDSFARIGGAQSAGGLIGGLNFGPTTFAIPTFDGSVGSFQTAPVPEPATWSMLIAGFGLLGAALRRRRVLAYN
jgi:hypothetical protein